jgi:putative lipoprotein
MAQTITGTATFRERMALPPAAVFEAVLVDASSADAPAETIAQTRVTSPGNPPIEFTITYDPARILPNRQYVVRARILLDDKLLFTTDTATPVITGDNPSKVSLMLRRVPGGSPGGPAPAATTPLEDAYWRAIELAGKPTTAQDQSREAHLLFEKEGRVSGSDGCNRLMGSYQLKADTVTFGQMAGTQMACIDAAVNEIERAFREALKGAARFKVAGGGSDDTTLTPSASAKYTIEFRANGQLAARIDCNRGKGTWKSTEPSGLEFGPLALTRAKCPEGSLHDHIVKQWPYVRSYVIRNGHLFLALMADGGIYEFEPVTRTRG